MPLAIDRQTSIPLHERVDLMDAHERGELIQAIDFAVRYPGLSEQLRQLHDTGPCWDGDVISKSDRDALLEIGACDKVVVRGAEGFNACTYYGRFLLRIYDWLAGEPNRVDRPVNRAA